MVSGLAIVGKRLVNKGGRGRQIKSSGRRRPIRWPLLLITLLGKKGTERNI